MKIKEYGNGNKILTIVGGTHGDEPMTAEALDVALEMLENQYDEMDLGGKVKFLTANERALKEGVRYTEKDLNRVFPGDSESDVYEERLAARVLDEVKDSHAVLSLHSSYSTPPEFAITSNIDDRLNQRTALHLPVRYISDNDLLRGTTLDGQFDRTVTIEAGKPGEVSTREFSVECILSFLTAHGVIDRRSDTSECNIIRADREIEKGTGEPKVYYQNFETVPVGEVIAEDDVVRHTASNDRTVPILLSANGYEDIFGLIGTETGVLTENGIELYEDH